MKRSDGGDGVPTSNNTINGHVARVEYVRRRAAIKNKTFEYNKTIFFS